MSADEAQTPEMAAIQDDVERTRAELGSTVDELAQRLDVKTRAKEQWVDLKVRVKVEARRRKVHLSAAGAALITAFVVRRVRRSS